MPQQRTKRILVDMDAILANFMGPLLAEYNRLTDESVTMDQITTWDMVTHVKHPKVLTSIFQRPGFFRALPLLPGARWAMQVLDGWKLDNGDPAFEVVIVSSPCTPWSAAEKMKWLEIHLPFLSPKKVILCQKKYMVKGDFLIDDGVHNAKAQREEWPGVRCYTIAYPYNSPDQGGEIFHGRFGSWWNPRAGWHEIVSAICKSVEGQ